MKIGVLSYRFNYYPYLRNILYKLPEAEYIPVKDLYSNLRRVALSTNRRVSREIFPTFDLNNQFNDFNINKVDILHFFNGVSYGRTPWVAHFETLLPRFSSLMQRSHGKTENPLRMTPLIQSGINALQSPYCKRIIAMSQSAAVIQKNLLLELPPEDRRIILDKLIVLHPPQKSLVEKSIKRTYDKSNPIRFILVGAGFFRKGGREILNSFDNLINSKGAPIQLVLVSSLRLDSYASKETQSDIAWAKQFIIDHTDWIEHYETLDHDKVIDLMKTCDIGLLPTYADTYGFSVLEAQACGCPVISTDGRALPEINNGDVGWLIYVPKNDLGEALYSTPEERDRLSQQIQLGLEEIILKIIADPIVIYTKGMKAIERIRKFHDPLSYTQQLREIYKAALI